MRPLARIHAITDGAVLASPDLGIRAAAIAAAGPAVALHVRDRAADGAALTAASRRFLALARPPEASVFVNARADIAAALGAQGLQLGSEDLTAREARGIFPRGWIGRSVHTQSEAAEAVDEGADFLLVGNIFETRSHPGRPAAGLDLIREAASLGRPVIAIGGIDPERAAKARDAGAYGVAAISALWYVPDSAAAALALLQPWVDAS